MPSHSPANIGKSKFEKWDSNPPQVTSYLSIPDDHANKPTTSYVSPNCGFGWRFLFNLERCVTFKDLLQVIFQPNICSSMPFHDITIRVVITYPNQRADGHRRTFKGLSVQSDQDIGLYSAPLNYRGETRLEITLIFKDTDGLSLPTTSPRTITSPSISSQISSQIKTALLHSLDGPSFVDVKFYLFSTRHQGKPARPKAIFARSALLAESSDYLQNLLSSETEYTTGSPCDLRADVPEEIAKLDTSAFMYDSDSDLDDEEDENPDCKAEDEEEEVTQTVERSERQAGDPKDDKKPRHQDGKAFAINGTAYKTWRAFIFYAYTNEIKFRALKSRGRKTKAVLEAVDSNNNLCCSPKSMYRFADYADLPHLKLLAKEAIKKNLFHDNIIKELFSSFTYKYPEIIELEVDYLVDNFTKAIGRDFNSELQTLLLGTKPHCFRVLAFAMRRLLGDTSEAAWEMLDEDKESINEFAG
ncbi:hypothetical protein AN958_05600 [Leucoagaricus sp. SymC.cos]|nr:hypothetical protein AN958_05600 [Leucoagaricus sp. SymC.cos]